MLFLDPTDHLVEYWFKLLCANYNGVIIVESCLSKFQRLQANTYMDYTSELRELLSTLYLFSGLWPSVWGKITCNN